jgi:hypothetical protein
MATYKVLCVLLVFSASALAGLFDQLFEEEREIGEEERQLALELRELRERRLSCKKQGETCKGLVPCCGSLQCYWKDGYSLKTDGYCVECIQRNQICQRDASCCSGLVCQKEKFGYTDGRCDSPRAAGGKCHENDQCASKKCNISWLEKYTGKEGSCA